MTPRPRKPSIPRPASDTVRHAILALLRAQTLSAKDISILAHLPEKEIYGHLDHLRLSLQGSDESLAVSPAECKGCGFVFHKRDRLTPPGKCPVCREQSIRLPLYTVKSKRRK